MRLRSLATPMTLAAAVAALTACGAPAEVLVTDRYVPFDQAAVATAQGKLATVEAFRKTLEDKDFAVIQSGYDASVKADLRALVAGHSYVEGGAQLGVTLDQQAVAAITAGAASTDLKVKEVNEEKIQTILFRQGFETVYANLKRGDRAGWDTAFGWYGRSTDGNKSEDGVASLAAERDTEFATTKNQAIFTAFITGRNALAKGDTATVSAQAAIIDKAMTEVFGLSARHEFNEAAVAIQANTPDGAVEGFAVGSGHMSTLRDYLKTLPMGSTTVATIDGELAKGDPTMPQTMSLVKFSTILSSLDAAFGFKF